MTHTTRITAVFSAKGGVGKSSLACALAFAAAAEGRRVWVWDLDMFGTSLADGLGLLAPRLHTRRDNGEFEMNVPPDGQFLEPSQIMEGRRARLLARRGAMGIPFLNYAFHFSRHGDVDCRLDALCWKHPQEETIRWLPSSPLNHDVIRAVDQLHGNRDDPLAWMRRFSWLLHAAWALDPAIDDHILDLPPGLFGFTREVVRLLTTLAQDDPFPADFAPLPELTQSWDPRFFLVASPDRNDLKATFSHPVLVDAPGVVPVVNRNDKPPETILSWLRLNIPAMPFDWRRILFVDEDRDALGELFRRDRLPLVGREWARLASTETIRGAWNPRRLP